MTIIGQNMVFLCPHFAEFQETVRVAVSVFLTCGYRPSFYRGSFKNLWVKMDDVQSRDAPIPASGSLTHSEKQDLQSFEH